MLTGLTVFVVLIAAALVFRYTDEQDALQLLTSAQKGSTTIKDVLGCNWSLDVERVGFRGNGHLGTPARPVNGLDSPAVLQFLDGNGIQSYQGDAEDLTFTFKKANGNSATVVLALMVAGTSGQEGSNERGAYPFQQAYAPETATPIVTVTQ